jgi:hypothetical protein
LSQALRRVWRLGRPNQLRLSSPFTGARWKRRRWL